MRPEIIEEFDLPTPYNLWHSVRFQRMGKLDPRVILDRNHYAFASNLPSGPATALVELQDTKLRCRLWGPGSHALLEKIPTQLGLTMPLLAEGIETLPKPLRLVRAQGLRRTARGPERVIETLVPIVLQQLVTWREAAKSWRALLQTHGEPAPGPLKLRLPPTLASLRSLTLGDFRRLDIASKRARTILAICERLSRGANSDQPDLLLKLKGIGPWTDALYRGLELGEPDVVPVGDYHLPSTVSWALTQDRHATDETMLKLLEPYRGYRFEIIRLIMGANIAAPRRSPRMPQRKPQSLR